jgi:hypothetical protein
MKLQSKKECRIHNEDVEVLKICQIHLKIFLIEKMLTKVRSYNLIVNDILRQSINYVQNQFK